MDNNTLDDLTRQQVQAAIDTLLNLNDSGVGLVDVRGLTKVEQEKELKSKQKAMLGANQLNEFRSVMAVLSTIGKTEKFNHKYSSYGLKHQLAHLTGYSSNGIFIAAAIHLGFRTTPDKSGNSVIFNMEQMDIDRLIATEPLGSLNSDVGDLLYVRVDPTGKLTHLPTNVISDATGALPSFIENGYYQGFTLKESLRVGYHPAVMVELKGGAIDKDGIFTFDDDEPLIPLIEYTDTRTSDICHIYNGGIVYITESNGDTFASRLS